MGYHHTTYICNGPIPAICASSAPVFMPSSETFQVLNRSQSMQALKQALRAGRSQNGVQIFSYGVLRRARSFEAASVVFSLWVSSLSMDVVNCLLERGIL